MRKKLLALAALAVLALPAPVDARRRHSAVSASVPGAVPASVPLPPERPENLGDAPAAESQTQGPAEAPGEPPTAYAAPIEPESPPAPFVVPSLSGSACLARLRAAGVDFEPADQPAAPLSGCHIDTPVRVGSVPVSGRHIELPAKPLLDCAYVLHFADFTAQLAAPLGPQTMHSPLAALDTGPGYECRGRNRVHGARISAHGKGIALDVSGFVFEDGRKAVVGERGEAGARAYFASFRKGACGWFTTVLGPGSDGYHERHLHLDTEGHGRGGAFRVCH